MNWTFWVLCLIGIVLFWYIFRWLFTPIGYLIMDFINNVCEVFGIKINDEEEDDDE